mmetsp:Transcript_14352/g.39228  ORF Transcript_14352/g.39228 Transcript_14352/m.39228 type:complete len:101 (+) Transcript_14352:460-762(+)
MHIVLFVILMIVILFLTKVLCEKNNIQFKNQPSNKTFDIDHIIQLAKNGTNEFKNLQALCKSCHRDKTRNKKMANMLKFLKLNHLMKSCKISRVLNFLKV